MSGPLDGVNVLDLSSVISGPIATVMLADQGADVIKVEPLSGDIVRHMGMGSDGLSAGFLTANRGKRSIALDLKTDAGLDVVKSLAAQADVFVQNFRPGAIERMGLGEEVIKAIRPNIIYVSISGFGEKGPYAHKRVYDPVIQALSGITDIQGDRETGRPRMVRTLIPDKTTALTAAQAITAALFARERTGQGQTVKIAMIDAAISFLWAEGLAGLSYVGKEKDVLLGQLAQDLIFETKDGYITAGAVSDKEWEGMCIALEKPQWLDDERFSTPRARVRNMKVRLESTGAELKRRTSAEWLERLDAHGVPCAPILTRQQLIHHEQIKANELLTEYDHPTMGRVRQPRPAAQFQHTPAKQKQLAPKIGQHGPEILREIGRSETEIQRLIDDGIMEVTS